MPFKFKDLIVTVIPRGEPGSVVTGSGGCGGCSDAGSASVGSCSSEGECVEQCFDSGEVIDISPYKYIDPSYQLELRQLLVYALAKSDVKTPKSQSVQELEKQMQPGNLEEINVLEKELTSALEELRQQKQELQKQAS